MSENKGYGNWFAAIFITIYGLVVHSLLKNIVPSFLTTKKKVNCTSEISSFIKGGPQEKDIERTISGRFEEMCIKNPLAYKKDPRIKKVISDYRDLLKGRILDPEGENAPSVLIDGEDNPDYYRYLRNQNRALKSKGYDNSWVSEEMARVTNKKNAADIEYEYSVELVRRGVPQELLDTILSYDRIESHTPDSWNKLIKAVKGALDFGADIDFIEEFLSLVEDPDYYDKNMMDDYSTLRGEGLTEKISLEYAKRNISIDQAAYASKLLDRGYEEEEALLKVLEELKNEIEEDDLREEYRSKI
jgi:hypothetical protein